MLAAQGPPSHPGRGDGARSCNEDLAPAPYGAAMIAAHHSARLRAGILGVHFSGIGLRTISREQSLCFVTDPCK